VEENRRQSRAMLDTIGQDIVALAEARGQRDAQA
jgi:hypothetical protein